MGSATSILDSTLVHGQPFHVGLEIVNPLALGTTPGLPIVSPTAFQRVVITDIVVDTADQTEVVVHWLGGNEIFKVEGANATEELHGLTIAAPAQGIPVYAFGTNTTVTAGDRTAVTVSGYFENVGRTPLTGGAYNRYWDWTEATIPIEGSTLNLFTVGTNRRVVIHDIYVDTDSNTEIVVEWEDGDEIIRIAGADRTVHVGNLSLVNPVDAKGVNAFSVGAAAGLVGIGYSELETYDGLPPQYAHRWHKKIELAGGNGSLTYATLRAPTDGNNIDFVVDRVWLDNTEGADRGDVIVGNLATPTISWPTVEAEGAVVKDEQVNAYHQATFCLARNWDAAGTDILNGLVEGYYLY